MSDQDAREAPGRRLPETITDQSVITTDGSTEVRQPEARCNACDVAATQYLLKAAALAAGDIPTAAQADAEGALAEDIAVIFHGFDNVVPQFGADHG